MELVVVSLLTGGGFAFVQFLIQRADSRKDRKHVLQQDCKETREAFNKYFSADKDRLDKLTKSVETLAKGQEVLIKNDLVMLRHMRTKNETGQILEREDATDNFLLEK